VPVIQTVTDHDRLAIPYRRRDFHFTFPQVG
jgi:hypothetical protein